ncbi:restriction endonuclease subunit S [Streptococcus hyovaginalis]
MAKNWSNIRLGDICQTNKSTYSLSEKWDYVNYLDTGNLTQDKVSDYQHIVLGQDKLPSRARRKVEVDDILYSTVRPNQLHYGIARKLLPNTLVSTGFAVITVDKEKANSDFIYYYLTQNDVTETLQAIGEQSTSAYPSIKPSDIENLEISLPTLEEQEVIAHTLRSLDQKIEVNREINHHLEQVAVSIFDEMFPNVNSGEHTIGEYITPKRGKGLLSKNAVAGSIPVIAGGLQPATYHNTANTKAPVVTISASGANAGYVGLWNTSVWSSDSSFIDSVMTDNVYFWYIMLSKRQQEIYDMQTGSAQPHIYPKHISIMPTIELEQSLVDEYNSRVTPLFETIGANTLQNRKLEETRDSLLPKLMSGELTSAD